MSKVYPFLLFVFLIIGTQACSNVAIAPEQTPQPSTDVQIAPANPMPSRTVDPPPKADPSPSPEALLHDRLLLQLSNDPRSEIWFIDPPYRIAEPLFFGKYWSYGNAIWSQDGQWIAYSKTAMGCPTNSSSIWISRPDGSEARQISESIEGKINQDTGNCLHTVIHPASPKYWLHRSNELAVSMYGLFTLSIDDGKKKRVYPKEALASEGLDEEYIRSHLTWRSFSSHGDRAFINTSTRENTIVLLWLDLNDPLKATILHPPPEFMSHYFGYGHDHTWSSDGKHLIFADRNHGRDRLWWVDVENDFWEVVNIKPFLLKEESSSSEPFRYVSSSQSSDLIAWWSETDFAEVTEFRIAFINTESWDVVRVETFITNRLGSLGDWITTSSGDPRFLVWKNEVGEGLYLLDPNDGNRDQLLVPFETLAAQIYRINALKPGPWQP